MPIAANDNTDPLLWPLPPVAGVVGDDGRVTWAAETPWPNDPREA